jgi:hypothetical protein
MEATCQEQFAVDSVVVLCDFISGRKMEVRSVERVDETRLRAVGKVRALCPFPEFDFHMLQKPQHFSFEDKIFQHGDFISICRQCVHTTLLTGASMAATKLHTQCVSNISHQPWHQSDGKFTFESGQD